MRHLLYLFYFEKLFFIKFLVLYFEKLVLSASIWCVCKVKLWITFIRIFNNYFFFDWPWKRKYVCFKLDLDVFSFQFSVRIVEQKSSPSMPMIPDPLCVAVQQNGAMSQFVPWPGHAPQGSLIFFKNPHIKQNS